MSLCQLSEGWPRPSAPRSRSYIVGEGRSVGHVIEAIVRERPLDGGAGLIELRVAVVGNVDSGKSTLVARWRSPAVPSRRRRERRRRADGVPSPSTPSSRREKQTRVDGVVMADGAAVASIA